VVLLKPAGALEDAGIEAEDGALAAVTKLYNYINSASLSSAEMMAAVFVAGVGRLVAGEVADALRRLGIALPREALSSMLGHVDLSASSAGGVRPPPPPPVPPPR
jgi:hypothetical protein